MWLLPRWSYKQVLVAAASLVVMASFLLLSGFPAFPSTESCEAGQKASDLLHLLHGKVQRFPGDTLKVDMGGASWRPWREDGAGSPCSHYHTRFGKGLTPVLLVSVPSSGSTWLRYLLEGATGFFTGSPYNDTILYDAGFLGEMNEMYGGRTLVQRTHGASFYPGYLHDLQDRYEHVDPHVPTILLLRDPARTLISYWKLHNLAGSNKHLDDIPKELYYGDSFREFVGEATSLWEELATDRLLWVTRPLFVLHYEDLVASPALHLRRILHFLNVPVDEGRLACLAAHLDGSFKRNSSTTFDPFVPDEKERFAHAASRVDRLLEVMGYPRLPSRDRLW